MKKLFALVFFTTFLVYGLQAQDYKKFRVGLGVGYAGASGKGAKGGVLIALEPGYRITDKFLVNLRLESAAVVRGQASEDPSNPSVDLDVAAIGSYTVNTQYYPFTFKSFRTIVGAGTGLYSLAAVKASSNSSGTTGDIAASASKFGFELGHFSLVFDYNIIGKTEGVNGEEFKNSYYGIRIGAFFGGGRK
jgi:hypothetical protein